MDANSTDISTEYTVTLNINSTYYSIDDMDANSTALPTDNTNVGASETANLNIPILVTSSLVLTIVLFAMVFGICRFVICKTKKAQNSITRDSSFNDLEYYNIVNSSNWRSDIASHSVCPSGEYNSIFMPDESKDHYLSDSKSGSYTKAISDNDHYVHTGYKTPCIYKSVNSKTAIDLADKMESNDEVVEINEVPPTDPSAGDACLDRDILCYSASTGVISADVHSEDMQHSNTDLLNQPFPLLDFKRHSIQRMRTEYDYDLCSRVRESQNIKLGEKLADNEHACNMSGYSTSENRFTDQDSVNIDNASQATVHILTGNNSDTSAKYITSVMKHQEPVQEELNNENEVEMAQTTAHERDENTYLCMNTDNDKAAYIPHFSDPIHIRSHICHFQDPEGCSADQTVYSINNDNGLDNKSNPIESLNTKLGEINRGYEDTAVKRCSHVNDDYFNMPSCMSEHTYENMNQISHIPTEKSSDPKQSVDILISTQGIPRQKEEFDIYEIPDDLSSTAPSIITEEILLPASTGNTSEETATQSQYSERQTYSVVYDNIPECEPVKEDRKLYNKDMTNKPWGMKGQVTGDGFQLSQKNSDVVLSISPKAVDVPTLVSGSVLLAIPQLRKLFDMQKTELIVAPVVEFQLEQVKSLHTHACIQMPHCMGQNVEKMQVWWFSHDRSNKKIERKLVPAKGDVNPEACSEDTFWTIANYCTVNIFTKHFSGFLCTACDHYVDCDMRAYLFHLFGDIDDETTLSLNLKLGGPLSRITDFEQTILSEMKSTQFTLVNKKSIALDQCKEGCLHFNVEMVGKTSCDWQPVKRANGQNVYDDHQEVALDQLLTCGKDHVIATENEWYLQCNSDVVKRCSVCVDVKHVVNKDTKPVQTTMHGELIPPPKYVYMGPEQNNSNYAFLRRNSVVISQRRCRSSILREGESANTQEMCSRNNQSSSDFISKSTCGRP